MNKSGQGGQTKFEGDLQAALRIARQFQGVLLLTSSLSVRVFRRDGRVEDLGVVCRHLVTTAFVNYMVDQLQSESSTWGDFKYHECGTGTTDPAVGDTDIETPIGVARVAGSQTEGASANIYKTVGEITSDGTYAVTEHGLFNDLSAGTLMDRHEFAAINVTPGDKIEFTYQLNCNAGG